jgi:hypothetical protein
MAYTGTNTSGFILTSNGPSTMPSFQAPPSGVYYSLSPFIVGTDSNSQYSTIAAGMAAAVAAGAASGTPMNVYIKPKADGTAYTENLTLAPGANLVGFGGTVTIIGKLSQSTGVVSITGLTLQTNSDFILDLTSTASISLTNCYINATNNTAISSTGTNEINLNYCNGNLYTTGIGLYSITGAASLVMAFCNITNSGTTSTASNSASTSSVYIRNCYLSFPVSTSGSALLDIFSTELIQTANVISVTFNGTVGGYIEGCYLVSGTASAVSIGIGANGFVVRSSLESSNTNVITGLGSLNYALISFVGSSSGHNVTTEISLPTLL